MELQDLSKCAKFSSSWRGLSRALLAGVWERGEDLAKALVVHLRISIRKRWAITSWSIAMSSVPGERTGGGSGGGGSGCGSSGGGGVGGRLVSNSSSLRFVGGFSGRASNSVMTRPRLPAWLLHYGPYNRDRCCNKVLPREQNWKTSWE